MMSFIPLVILFALAGTGSIVLDRRLQRRKQQTPAVPVAESVKKAVTDFATSERGRLGTWRDRIMRRQPADLPARFQAWAANAPGGNASAQEWLQSLSDKGLQAFTHQLAGFCSEIGFELESLVGQQLDRDPELAHAMRQVVWHYCQACQQAAEAQDDLEAYKQLQAFEHNPTSGTSQAFGKKFFARAVDEGLTSVTMSQYMAAPPKQQSRLIMQSINETAGKDQKAFKRILKDVVRDAEAVPPSPATSTVQAGAQEPAAAPSPA